MRGFGREGLSEEALAGRLTARPPAGRAYGREPAGEFPLGLGDGRDGILVVPKSYDPAVPTPLMIALHGAGSGAERILNRLGETARAYGAIIVAPDSRDVTWDILRGGYGPDIAFLDRVLNRIFDRFHVDPAHLAVEGFSDGASYGLSIGIANGDLFSHIISNSPGFVAPPGQAGSPKIYISHGTEDAVLPIDMCSRLFVQLLERVGYDLTYREFQGPHTLPPEVLVEMLAWWLGDWAPGSAEGS
ncbi:MAG TPA: alpha/beta hydrolase [Dehalococcoidia bacterium]|nr:alpha/beta hydrolase [Dehalococcoidia bacterium]